jgi:hypothetical protein
VAFASTKATFYELLSAASSPLRRDASAFGIHTDHGGWGFYIKEIDGLVHGLVMGQKPNLAGALQIGKGCYGRSSIQQC